MNRTAARSWRSGCGVVAGAGRCGGRPGPGTMIAAKGHDRAGAGPEAEAEAGAEA